MPKFDKDSLKKLLKNAIMTTGSVGADTDTRAQQLGSDFLVKQCLSAYTFYYGILQASPTEDMPEIESSFTISDFPTANVIVRTMFETLMNMHHVLIEPATEEEREFRMDLWDHHKFSGIRKMGKSFRKEVQDNLEQVEKEYKEIRCKIKFSPLFSQLTPDEQKEILNKEKWTTLSRFALAERCGFHKSHSDFLYKFLSNYAHSEAYSLMQIRAIKTPKQAEERLNTLPLTYTVVCLAQVLTLTAELYPQVKEQILKDEELLEILRDSELFIKEDLADLGDEEDI